jgi:GxxExxY protein
MEQDPLSAQVIGCAYKVMNGLGPGYLEKVYENALAHELRKLGLVVRQQWRITVNYDGVQVGDSVADLLVQDLLLVELKAVSHLEDIHLAQYLNYVKATGVKACLLLNFGSPTVEVRRLVNHFNLEAFSS